jgi:hypothetical protein
LGILTDPSSKQNKKSFQKAGVLGYESCFLITFSSFLLKTAFSEKTMYLISWEALKVKWVIYLSFIHTKIASLTELFLKYFFQNATTAIFHPDLHHSHGGLKFATQISPLHNFLTSNIFFRKLERENWTR